MACHGLTRPGLAKRIDTMPLPDQAWQTGSMPWFYQAVTMVLPGAYQTRPTKKSKFFLFCILIFFLTDLTFACKNTLVQEVFTVEQM